MKDASPAVIADSAAGEVVSARPPLTLRIAERLQANVWPTVLLFAGLALIATLSNATGLFVGDNTFAFFWTPASVLSQYGSVWNAVQGLGHLRLDFWPVTIGYLDILRRLGFNPWIAERLWHATLLAAAGIGAVQVLRLFRPRIGLEHLVAGLLYAFGPWSAAAFIPSNLFLYFALAPWLVFAATNGLRGDRPWRWAGVFALLIFATGNTNYPSLVYALLPVVLMVAYLGSTERCVSWDRTWKWFGRVAPLVLLVSAAAITTTGLSTAALRQNLSATESPLAISSVSSWAESWRGLGFWLAYFRDTRGLVLPQLGVYFWFWPVALATFVAPIVAVMTVAWSRWRPRLVFAAMMLLGLVLMVGAFPIAHPSPYGRALLQAYDSIPFLSGLRNSFKAGPLLMLGVGALAGVGLVAAVAWVRQRRRRLTVLPIAAAFATIACISVPFFANHLYAPSNRAGTIPSYWYQAVGWLNRQPGDGRVLVLPSTQGAEYRWGSFADDLLGLINRPVVTRQNIDGYEGSADSADLVDSLDDYINSGAYQAGSLAPIARRLGIRYVLIRNDLNWQALRRPRPADLDAFRADPGLHLAHAFGAPGQNVVAPSDHTSAARSERRLPPVEIYQVDGSTGQATVNSAPALLVSGNGAAWPLLARSGLLASAGPVRYTARLSTSTMIRALSSSSTLVITDTNQRITDTAPTFDAPGQHSYILGPDETLPGTSPPPSLFGRAGSQSVAYSPVTTRITASSYGSLFAIPQIWLRPSNAFDGNPGTSWRSSGPSGSAGAWIRADLRTPTVVSSVELVDAPGSHPRVTRADVKFSDGSSLPVDLTTATRADVAFAPRKTKWIEVHIDKTTSAHNLGSPGFAEIRVGDLDLRPFVQVPDDVFRVARRSPKLTTLVEAAPIQYQFTSLGKQQGMEAEPTLLRRFRTLGTRSFNVAGTLRFTNTTSSTLITAALQGRIQPFSAALPGGGGTPPSDCQGLVVQIDGRDVPVRIGANAPSLLNGDAVPFVSCAPVTLGSGWHTFETGVGLAVDDARLASGTPTLPWPRVTVRTVSRTPDRVDVAGQASRHTAVVVGPTFQEGWEAVVDGHDLGRATELDTLSGWELPKSGRFRLVAEQAERGPYLASLAATGVGVALCLTVAVTPRRRRARAR